MKEFFAKHGVWILLAAVIITVSMAALSAFGSGVASPFKNAAGIVSAPFRAGISTVTGWVDSRIRFADDYDALKQENKELKEKIACISLMGGGVATGNWTPAAEFNILVDPESAKLVFESGIPLVMAGLDVTEKALILPEDFARIRAIGNPVSDIVAQWLEFFYIFHRKLGYEGAPMHDPCAVMALIHPELFRAQDMYVQIETGGEYCRGCTVADRLGTTGRAPNARVLLDVDRRAFADILVEAMKFYGEGAK